MVVGRGGGRVMVIIVQSLSCVQFFVTPWTAAHQASLSITISWSLLKLMSIKSMMPANRLILCYPLLLPPSIFPSIRGRPLCRERTKAGLTACSYHTTGRFSILRVPWTARRSNQSILKEISPEYSLEGLMLKLKLQYFGHLMA